MGSIIQCFRSLWQITTPKKRFSSDKINSLYYKFLLTVSVRMPDKQKKSIRRVLEPTDLSVYQEVGYSWLAKGAIGSADRKWCMTLIKCVQGGGLTADVATSTALAACLLHRQLYVHTGGGRSIPRHTVSRGNLIFLNINIHKSHICVTTAFI